MCVFWVWLCDYVFDINYINEFDVVISFFFCDMIIDFCMFLRLVELVELVKLIKIMILFVNGFVII